MLGQALLSNYCVPWPGTEAPRLVPPQGEFGREKPENDHTMTKVWLGDAQESRESTQEGLVI